MIQVAVVGTGYWGPNLVRNLASVTGVTVHTLCDLDVAKAERIRQRACPEARIETDAAVVAANPEIDAVVIATPVRSHHQLCRRFLEAGKHVFVEKPLAQSVAECADLVALAEQQGRILMVGHVFIYNPAVVRIREILAAGDLGSLLYIYSQRVNLGRVQTDLNAMWSFAPHDLSILDYWLGAEPERVSARGFSCLGNGIEDVVFMVLEYPGGIGAHLHLGWLDPRKQRQMTLVGSKQMLVYDDVSLDAKITLYDRGIKDLHDFIHAPKTFADFQVQLRSGDIRVPALSFSEPLQRECQHFVDCIRNGERPITDAAAGLRVVKVLEAGAESLRQGGVAIALAD